MLYSSFTQNINCFPQVNVTEPPRLCNVYLINIVMCKLSHYKYATSHCKYYKWNATLNQRIKPAHVYRVSVYRAPGARS